MTAVCRGAVLYGLGLQGHNRQVDIESSKAGASYGFRSTVEWSEKYGLADKHKPTSAKFGLDIIEKKMMSWFVTKVSRQPHTAHVQTRLAN